MPTPIDPKKLPGLKAALETFGPDDMLPHQDLAALYAVTPARLTTLIHNRFESYPPHETRGDKTHWYNARAAIQAMIAYLQKSGKKKKASAAAAAAIMGTATEAAAEAQPEAEEPPPLGPAELDRLASASTKIWKLALDQRKYIPATVLAHWARAQNELQKRTVSQIPHAIDPAGELPPLTRARLESLCRELLVKMNEDLVELLSTMNLDEDHAD